MIETIKTTKEKNKLIVEVVCKARKFAVHPIKVLTTEELIAKLKTENKYNIVNTLKTPSRPVGNTTRKKIKLSGTWVFELEEVKNQNIVKKTSRSQKVKNDQPTKKTTTKKTTTRKQSTRPKRSIRSRISDLATKED
jgi:hypothetical protein